MRFAPVGRQIGQELADLARELARAHRRRHRRRDRRLAWAGVARIGRDGAARRGRTFGRQIIERFGRGIGARWPGRGAASLCSFEDIENIVRGSSNAGSRCHKLLRLAHDAPAPVVRADLFTISRERGLKASLKILGYRIALTRALALRAALRAFSPPCSHEPADSASSETGPDFRHVESWIFDLDNTLYPASSDLFAQIDARMTAFVQALLGLGRDEARALQKAYYRDHGTTLNGLMQNPRRRPGRISCASCTTSISPALDARPAPRSRRSRGLPGRRFVFTNGCRDHAARVLTQLGARSPVRRHLGHPHASTIGPSPTEAYRAHAGGSRRRTRARRHVRRCRAQSRAGASISA